MGKLEQSSDGEFYQMKKMAEAELAEFMAKLEAELRTSDKELDLELEKIDRQTAFWSKVIIILYIVGIALAILCTISK